MAKIIYTETRVLGVQHAGIYFPNNETVNISYDSHTNPALASAINADPTAYLVIDGVLTRDGVPVAINPPCDDCAALDALDGATTVAQLRKALIVMRDKPGFTRG